MAIQLYDSLTRQLRPLAPADGRTFRMYCCGPTVYGPAHIGNFRTFVVNDVIRRLLELEFGAESVRHVRNITDVDDRTINQALKEKRPLEDITRHWTNLFHEDCAALNVLPPHVEPSATSHIAEQVEMIEGLMAKGHAYAAADGSVYFQIESFPGYGALSRIKDRELKVTDAAADSDHKNSVGDFALWKAYKPAEDGDVRWPGPRGAAAGRPGWHIECSAMIRKHLGPTIDLHTGGVDLLFPHHENEIAQSECGNGAPFARHWYHSEHLLVNGTTMSKSKGNYYTLYDLMAKGYSPMAVRYALLAGHPRKQLNFTLESLHAAESALGKLYRFAERLSKDAGVTVSDIQERRVSDVVTEPTAISACLGSLRDDLNFPAALGGIFAALDLSVGRTTGSARAHARDLGIALYAFGLRLNPPQTITSHPSGIPSGEQFGVPTVISLPPEIRTLAEKRWAAKKAKDFATADQLRAEIQAAGWQMLDGKDGYKLEPAKKA